MRKERPNMGEGLGGFESLYPVGQPPATIPDPATTVPPPVESAPETGPGSTERAPRTSRARKDAKVTTAEPKAEAPPRAKWGEGKTRDTHSFSLTDSTWDRLRAYAYAKGASLSDVAEVALMRAMDRAEEANGGPFPPPPRQERKSLDDL